VARTPAGSLKLMSRIITGDLFKFCSLGAQGQATTLRGWVSDLRSGHRPKMLSDTTDFMKTCSVKLSYFARVTAPPDDKEAPGAVLVGVAAVDYMYKQAQAIVESGKPYDLQTLSVGMYHWMLTQEKTEALAEWTSKLLKGIDHASAASKGSDELSKAEAKKDTKSRKGKDDVRQSVEDYFSGGCCSDERTRLRLCLQGFDSGSAHTACGSYGMFSWCALAGHHRKELASHSSCLSIVVLMS